MFDADRIRQSFARQAFMTTFEARLDEIAQGAVTISAPILPIAAQQQGYAHAGLTFALGDSAAGYSALSLLPADQEVVTSEMKINLLAPATGDRLVARGRVVKPGRRLIVVLSEVFCGDRQVALLTGTMVPVPA
ncbi:PaaI family thioesterase [Thalassococcus sp. CAU 1522]|uniref:PaaI family thioesterase n=1 Tax=Thalassococcus arenae TaxID=2851652 RepID=A0ABS6N482_9RHOB|nr:PaaI family thioesterase [Thalassococcus arenae]MBV2358816.1 PaaI family thioesterase [Thalassococcus arenae]